MKIMKVALLIGPLLGLAVLIGCGRTESRPRFPGRIVAHVDRYGSRTGNEANLDREGSIRSGFDYGASSKANWTSDIKWRFLRRAGGSDLYRVEWTFRPQRGTGETKVTEASFDGMESVMVFSNQWQVVSIEPGSMKTNSQPAAAADALPRTPEP